MLEGSDMFEGTDMFEGSSCSDAAVGRPMPSVFS